MHQRKSISCPRLQIFASLWCRECHWFQVFLHDMVKLSEAARMFESSTISQRISHLQLRKKESSKWNGQISKCCWRCWVCHISLRRNWCASTKKGWLSFVLLPCLLQDSTHWHRFHNRPKEWSLHGRECNRVAWRLWRDLRICRSPFILSKYRVECTCPCKLWQSAVATWSHKYQEQHHYGYPFWIDEPKTHHRNILPPSG